MKKTSFIRKTRKIITEIKYKTKISILKLLPFMIVVIIHVLGYPRFI